MMSVAEIKGANARHDHFLESDEVEFIRQTVIQTAEATLNMRGVVPVRRVPEGTQDYSYDVMDKEGSSEIVVKGGDYPTVNITKSRTTVSVPKFGNSFYFAREDILSARMNGMQLSANGVMKATRLTAEKENDLIINGDSDYSVDGLLDKVGDTQSSSTTSGWDEDDASVAAIQKDIIDAWGKIDAGLAGLPLTLLLPKTEFQFLKKIDTSVNRDAMTVLLEIVDNIVWDNQMTADTGLLMAISPEVMEYILVEDINVVPVEDGDPDKFKWITRARGVLAVYQTGGLVDITGI